MIAALYVETDGPYFGLSGVDPWDQQRDARNYAGPHPVVAHPPCSRWSLMGLCRGYYDGEDDGCFEHALQTVRECGGVLEHPAHTLAWKRFGLPRPAREGWTRSLLDDGWTCEIDQRHYGHEANKPTWLYYVGPPPAPLRWGRAPRGERTVGRSWGQNREHLRARTPPAFRDALLTLVTRLALTRGRTAMCDAVLYHGPGHQSRARCRVKGDHEIHEAVYGDDTFAEWTGDEAITGFFDESPEPAFDDMPNISSPGTRSDKPAIDEER